MSASKPFYYVYVQAEEQAGDPDRDLLAFLAVWGEPTIIEITFESAWEQAKEACRAEGLWDWTDIVDKLEEWGFTITDHSDRPLFHVDC